MIPKQLHAHTVERTLALAAATWLMLVGVVTQTVAHHVLHALPLVVLGVMPRGRWSSHLSAATALAWIAMLSAFTPMIRHVLETGVDFTLGDRAYTWLAPVMVVISAVWGGLAIALLRGGSTRGTAMLASRTAAIATAVMLAVAGLLAAIQPNVGPALERMVTGAVELRPLALLALASTATVIVAGLNALLALVTHPRTPRVDLRTVGLHTAYWLFFVIAMVAGLAVSAR